MMKKYRVELHDDTVGFPNCWCVQQAYIWSNSWKFISGYYTCKEDAEDAITNKDFYGLFQNEPWLEEQPYPIFVIKEYRIDRAKRSFHIPHNHEILNVLTDGVDVVFYASVCEEAQLIKKNILILKTGDELEYSFKYGCSFDDLGVTRHIFYEEKNESY